MNRILTTQYFDPEINSEILFRHEENLIDQNLNLNIFHQLINKYYWSIFLEIFHSNILGTNSTFVIQTVFTIIFK